MMPLFETYQSALLAMLIIIITAIIQSLVAMKVKAARPGAIPGKIDPELSHESFVYRAHRTFMNTLENTPIMLATGFVAILSGTDAYWTGLLLWIYAVSRILHMILYYAIATEKNPSPRSFPFLAGFTANVVLAGMVMVRLL